MITLRFPLAPVIAVARHAVTAPAHRPSFLENAEGRTPTPALWLVGDDGIYLMSNGRLADAEDADANWPGVVYAGLAAATEEEIADEIGGDDFLEVLALLTQQPGQRNLYTELFVAFAAAKRHLIIDIDRSRLSLTL